MLIVIVLSFSVFFQLLAAFYALRYVKITNHIFSWILISSALILMTIRRMVPLYYLIFTPLSYPVVVFNEWIGLILSSLMFLGIKGIGRIFIERNQAELKYKTILDTTIDPFYIIDAQQGKILEVNDAYCFLMGYSRNELLNMSLKDIEAAESAEEIARHMQYILKKGADQFETRHRTKDGRILDLETSVNYMREDNEFFVFMHDITERKKVGDELKKYKEGLEKIIFEKTTELQKTYKELEDTKRLSDIGQLAATVAHELRNPLGVIKTAIYNINRKKKDSVFDSHLANIDKKISESDQIIRNLLSYAKIKMPHYESVDINNVLGDCIKQCKDKYIKWDVKINILSSSNDKNIIEVDPLHMAELFLNILDNAYQAFSDKSGLIQININKNTNQLEIEINDNGIGIDKEELKKIFDPFFTNRARGIGLGLAVCKQIVRVHNGSIDIKSQKKKGTSVYINLPVSKKHD